MMLFLALVLSVATAMPAPRKGEEYFDTLDTNTDGIITLHEAEHELTVASIFSAMDADCDGFITRGQILFYFREFVEAFDGLDLNGDGFLTVQEAETATTIGRIFAFFDTNADGQLERWEADRLIQLIVQLQSAAAAQGTACATPGP
ncbi:calcium-dependent protein kinase 16-like [Branchiostoma floridae]|uniref:Calcium-dependent protein kinase 16-like n=1 Tax=Branchiostoma floridae TaxID=7739 RepID=C3XZF1_BRAFL|nr:calcium-dependent protein kinase 16-like [Branchiostoma floridae]|eukprot:XP_002610705.1 hypothetical protein BRAFLDRAFT_65922 [Branchiostoma floridae]